MPLIIFVTFSVFFTNMSVLFDHKKYVHLINVICVFLLRVGSAGIKAG